MLMRVSSDHPGRLFLLFTAVAFLFGCQAVPITEQDEGQLVADLTVTESILDSEKAVITGQLSPRYDSYQVDVQWGDGTHEQVEVHPTLFQQIDQRPDRPPEISTPKRVCNDTPRPSSLHFFSDSKTHADCCAPSVSPTPHGSAAVAWQHRESTVDIDRADARARCLDDDADAPQERL